MKARRIKYILVLSFLIVLFGIYIGMIFFNEPKNTTDGDTINISDKFDNEKEDLSYLDNDDYGLESVPEKPSDALGIINYALNIYNNGKGSASTFKQTLDIKAAFGELSGTGNQWAEGTILRCGSKSLEETKYTYGNFDPSWLEGIALQYNVLKTGYQAINVDTEQDKAYILQVDDGSVILNSTDVNSALEDVKIIYSMEFPLAINSNNVNIKKFDSRSNKSYNIITISYKLEKLPQNVLDYYSANTKFRNVKFTSYEFTFMISKKTGKLARMIRTETFNSRGNGAASNLKMVTKSVYQQDFSAMDEVVDVREPYKNYL